MAESKFRVWLAQQPATKLFIKAFIDLAQLEFFNLKIQFQVFMKQLNATLIEQ